MGNRMWLSRLFSRFSLMPRAGRREYFRINVSPRYRSYIAPVRLALVAGCWLLFGGILWNIGHIAVGVRDAWRIQAELDRVQQQDRQLIDEVRKEGIDLSDAALKQLPAEVALANHLLEKRVMSWTAFLTGIEEAVPPRLAISGIRLDAGSSVVHLTGTAMSLEDITALTIGLQRQAFLRDPVLAQHRAGANGLVEFDVTVRYQRGRA